MMEIFVDTSALLPILNQDDQDYEASLRIWSRLAQERALLVTSNYVLVETLALIQNRLGMTAVQDFMARFRPLLQVVWVDESLHEAAMLLFLQANRRRLSLVDCVSFAVCRQRQIEQVFAFDHHFVEHGFTCL
jgi:uncharacterized protein